MMKLKVKALPPIRVIAVTLGFIHFRHRCADIFLVFYNCLCIGSPTGLQSRSNVVRGEQGGTLHFAEHIGKFPSVKTTCAHPAALKKHLRIRGFGLGV
ncbi:hypothetical protein ED312_17050 [Sinomicrobium pectinilyticum]|uniref:Uncharacterized protein n=1 Tax=Sinomicrobium pectinilyticum TaxID=1084421 RepID=A0A3N0E3I3_SINP1|nr:hypothetical protein ED312_17050 [Sinomicrobium pectinilyticum]